LLAATENSPKQYTKFMKTIYENIQERQYKKKIIVLPIAKLRERLSFPFAGMSC
jgi:hypothetical protein